MALQRISIKFLVTTEPVVADDASAHSGSWSEGHWDNVGIPLDGALMNNVLTARAAMLPKQAAIIGVRAQQYTISENKLVPGGTSTFKTRKPGLAAYNINIPQDAMLMSAAVAGNPNAVKFKLKSIPDEVIVRGEFNGDPTFKGKMTTYGNRLKEAGFGSVIKNYTNPSMRILSIAGGHIFVDSTFIGLGQYIRLRRVRDSITGRPISGSFKVTALNATTGDLTVAGLPTGAAAEAGGFGVLDQLTFGAYSTITFSRVTDGKIGGPFEKYRGRRSKRPA